MAEPIEEQEPQPIPQPIDAEMLDGDEVQALGSDSVAAALASMAKACAEVASQVAVLAESVASAGSKIVPLISLPNGDKVAPWRVVGVEVLFADEDHPLPRVRVASLGNHFNEWTVPTIEQAELEREAVEDSRLA